MNAAESRYPEWPCGCAKSRVYWCTDEHREAYLLEQHYQRGFEEGRDSITALPVLLTGVVIGALSVGAFAWALL